MNETCYMSHFLLEKGGIMKIAVLDTGYKPNVEDHGIEIINYNHKDGIDRIGHGTGIISLYKQLIPSSMIYSIKIFERSPEIHDVINALEFIQANLDVDVISMSFGFETHSHELEKLCKAISKKGILLIAAFSNDMQLTYPAAFDSVLGISSSSSVKRVKDIIYIKNSPINVLAYGGVLVINWINNEKKMVSGNSFTLPFVLKIIQDCSNNQYSLSKVLYALNRNCKDSIIKQSKNEKSQVKNRKKKIEQFSKVVVFPFNKENKNLIENSDLSQFDISKVLDVRISKKVTTKVTSKENQQLNWEIEDIESLDWNEDFDTFILGNIRELSEKLNFNYFVSIAKKCLEHNKNLVVYDNENIADFKQAFLEKGLYLYTPYLDLGEYDETNGEMWHISKPVVCIAGTSSKQGKFTLQLNLRRELKELGIKVSHISTEPNGELLGCDYVHPDGLGSDNLGEISKKILFLNSIINDFSRYNDLIMIGVQSNSIPYSFGNINSFPLVQSNLMLSAKPDVHILCVNCFDSETYIERTIKTLENQYESKVLCLVVFPLSMCIDKNTGEYHEKRLSVYEMSLIIEKFEKRFGIPVFENGENDSKLVNELISFFS